MKKNLLIVALLAICFGLSAQTLSTKKPKDKRSTNFSIVTNQQVSVEKVIKADARTKTITEAGIQNVLSSKKLKDGSLYRIVRLENGMVKRQLLNAKKQLQQNISTTPTVTHRTNLRADATDNALFEGFEGWDGKTLDWIPAGWVDDSKAGSPANATDIYGDPINFTWHVSYGGYYVAPLSGNYAVGVQWSFPYDIFGATKTDTINVIPPSPQDEWLISPSATVKKNDYTLAFDVNIDAFWARLNGYDLDEDYNFIWDFSAMHTIVEAYISVNGGDWVKKWDSKETVLSYTAEELEDIEFGDTGVFPWINVDIDLKDYVNQDIRLAIRYWDDGGESVYVDNVTVGYRIPSVSYRQPEGYLIAGLSPEYYSLNYNFLVGNAYTPTSWRSKSENVESFSWAFSEEDVFNEANPTVTLPFDVYDAPVLSGTGKGGTATYQWGTEDVDNLLLLGGSFKNLGIAKAFGLGNYDLNYNFTIYRDVNAADLAEIGTFTGVANYFEKPANKFMIDTLFVHAGNVVAKPNKPVLLKIYAVGENGALGDLIAESETYPADFILAQEYNGFKYYTIPFSFKAIDPETGREEDTVIDIETAFIAEFTNYESADIFFQYENHPSGANYAYLIFEEGILSMRALTGGNINTSLLFGLNATFPFLYTEDNKYDAPVAGGTKNVDIITYWVPDGWWLEEELPDWITLGDPIGKNDGTGTAILPVTVDALPGATTGRSANIKIYSWGCDVTIQVKQGDADYLTGISSAKTTEAPKVARQGDNFVLFYPASATSVSVYNIAGQRIADYKLDASGTYTMPAANWTKGIYVLKFTGINTAVKVVK